MASTINATGSGVVITGDSSGALNLQVGGSNAIQISSGGATTISSLSTTGSTISSGNLAFTGTGQRITGDMSTTTFVDRLSFQTTVTNGVTSISALPNGTATGSNANFYNNSDPTNSGLMLVGALSSEAIINSTIRGTGSYLPMTFYTGGSERVRLDTSGNLLVGTSTTIGTSNATLQVLRSASSSITIATSTIPVNTASFAGIDGWGFDGSTYFAAGTLNFRAAEGWSTTNHGSDIQFRTTASGSGGALFEVMRLTSTGALAFNGSTNYGSSGQVLTSNGNAPPTWQLPAGLPTMNIVSGTTQAAVANNHYVLTNASATTVTLPASPSAGAVVWVTVANGRVDNVIARNGSNINSLAENMTIDSAYAGVQLRYADATRGWVFT
jgi:hypothetical protein